MPTTHMSTHTSTHMSTRMSTHMSTHMSIRYATYFGFDGDWLPLIRLMMLAWMLPTDDHSL